MWAAQAAHEPCVGFDAASLTNLAALHADGEAGFWRGRRGARRALLQAGAAVTDAPEARFAFRFCHWCGAGKQEGVARLWSCEDCLAVGVKTRYCDQRCQSAAVRA